MKESNTLEENKKIIFRLMSKKRQKQLLKRVDYNDWNPFQKPKEPIEIRKDKTNKDASTLLSKFMASKIYKNSSITYDRGIFEMVVGLINNDDRILGMYEFSLWYNEYLKQSDNKSQA